MGVFADLPERKIDSRITDILVSFVTFAASRKVQRVEALVKRGWRRLLVRKGLDAQGLQSWSRVGPTTSTSEMAQMKPRDRLSAFLSTLTQTFPAVSSDEYRVST